jgi:hypothetical protein
MQKAGGIDTCHALSSQTALSHGLVAGKQKRCFSARWTHCLNFFKMLANCFKTASEHFRNCFKIALKLLHNLSPRNTLSPQHKQSAERGERREAREALTKDARITDYMKTRNTLSPQHKQGAERGERSEARQAPHQRRTRQ